MLGCVILSCVILSWAILSRLIPGWLILGWLILGWLILRQLILGRPSLRRPASAEAGSGGGADGHHRTSVTDRPGTGLAGRLVAARPRLAHPVAGGAMLACPVPAVGLVAGQPMTSRSALAVAGRQATVAASPARSARIALR
jgi:hypothetical protein